MVGKSQSSASKNLLPTASSDDVSLAYNSDRDQREIYDLEEVPEKTEHQSRSPGNLFILTLLIQIPFRNTLLSIITIKQVRTNASGMIKFQLSNFSLILYLQAVADVPSTVEWEHLTL